jgi:hypothetical protein
MAVAEISSSFRYLRAEPRLPFSRIRASQTGQFSRVAAGLPPGGKFVEISS